jgi:hypothetical protein
MDENIADSDRTTRSTDVENAEAALELIVDAECAGGRYGRAWSHEVTPVVKHCGVVMSGPGPVLQVNPSWLRELMARGELLVLVDEMRTWYLIENALSAAETRTGTHSAA